MLSSKELLENIEKCSKYDYNHLTEFISTLSHRIKALGEKEFISKYSTKDYINDYENLGKAHLCYFIALIEYLCHKINIEVPQDVKDRGNEQLDFILFHKGDILEYEVIKDINILIDAYNNGIEEFLSKNIIITDDAFDVI